MEHPGWVQSVTLLLCGLSESITLKWPSGVDAVASTYPLASQAIGRLLTLWKLCVPTSTYITGTSLHPIWCHPRVDRHFSCIRAAAPAGELYGVKIQPVALLADPRFCNCRTGTDRASIRNAFGLFPDEMVIMVSGGFLGLGKVIDSVEVVLCHPQFQVIALCGHNDKLRNKLHERDRIVALGFHEDIPNIYAAADVLIINSGGMSFNEVMVAGPSTIMYSELVGHGRTSAALLDDAGLAPWPKSSDERRAEIQWIFYCHKESKMLCVCKKKLMLLHSY